ncbi:MAG: hypothetical protein ABID54_00085 [Pseudomonadota bacterium]
MDYIPKFFQSYELIPKVAYGLLKDRPWVIWQLFDSRTLYTGDKIRQRYGKMIANTWYWKGEHQYRGWRPPDCRIGADYSQHRFGRALDLVSVETTAEEIRRDIKAGKTGSDGSIFQYITCIEDGVGWLHFDVRNYKGLLIVKP